MAAGISRFAVGLFKKVVLADSVAPYADQIFTASSKGAHLASPFQGWLGVIAYAFQIYFDFSGYSDMAIGLARIFGIRLPLNFHSPYKASIIEFWRRWHISLSRFLRDYLYIPLGGNRLGEGRHLTNLMITMVLGGLWHGAAWSFVVWGTLHGAYLILIYMWRKISAKNPGLRANWLGRIATFLAVCVAWVYFRPR